jgi:hypothetical protein
VSIGFAVDAFGTPQGSPADADLVDVLLTFRTFDQDVRLIALIGAVLAAAAFLLVALVGVAIRPLTRAVAARDLMVVLLVGGGILCVAGQLVHIAVIQDASSLAYCDCVHKVEEVIAQDKALQIGSLIQTWFNLGGTAMLAMGVALAGALTLLGGAFATMSYLVALALGLGVVLYALDATEAGDIVIGLTAAVGVSIWAVLLAQGAGRFEERAVSTA